MMETTCTVQNRSRTTERITYTEVGRRHSSRRTVAPNGSSSGREYWTTVIIRQDWAHTKANGIYAGLSYRIMESYVTTTPGTTGQLAHSSSSPWTD